MTKNRVHIATGDPLSRKGGLNTVVASISNAQRELGFTVEVLDEIKSPLLLGNFSKASKYKNLADFQRHTNSSAPLIEYHFAQTALLTYPLFASKSTPTIFHFHGPWFLEGKVQGNSRTRVLAKYLIERLVYKNQTIMTTHSNAFKQVLIDEFHVPEQKIQVVYPGVDLEKFQLRDKSHARQFFGLRDDQKVLLCIRRLEPRMGIHLAIDAIEHLSDCVLLIAGTGSLNESIRGYASKKHYSERILFLGVVDEANHALVYNAADLVVVPTLSFEGFGLVVWEAFASGVPVVASRVGGLTEALGDFAVHYSFEPGSVDELVEKIKFALDKNPPPETIRNMVNDRTWTNTALAIEAIASKTYGSFE